MADNAKIVLDVGMDRKDFFNGAKDVQNAIKSIQSSVVSMGREIRAAAGGYGTAMIQSAKASRDFESSIQGIKAKMQELSTSIASIKASADSFRTYSKSIESAEQEMGKLLEKQHELRNAGANLPSDEWQQNQENIEKTNAQLAIWEKNYYRFLDKYNEAVERINTGMTADGSRQLTKGEISTYTQTANINADYVNEISDKIEEAQGKLEEFKQAEADLIAQGKNLPSDEWQQLQAQIDQAQNRIMEMREIQENMRNAGYENADQSDTYKDQVQRLKELQDALYKTRQIRDEALKPPYIRGWENMTRLSAMITEGFGRIQYAAGTLKTAIQHPIQAADRALGALIASAGRAASSLAKMAGNAALSFLRNLASTARNAAIQLARLVSNAVVSGLRNLASAAKNAVVQLAKLTGGAIRSGLARIGSMAGDAAKRLLGLDKSARRASKGLGATFKTVLKYAFGVRSMYFLFRRLRQAFSDGIGEIAKKNPELKAALNGLKKAFSALKGSIASAFAPIVTVVAPALTMLINMLTGAMNAVGAFFAALTGKTSYQKSVGKVGDTASKSAKDVEKLNRQLAEFDHLNILTDKDSKDSSKTGKDSGLAYETVPIDKSILDFVKQIKELWNAEDFEGIGALFAEKINGIFKKIDKAVSWDNVGAKITKAVNAITGIINGLIYNIDWPLIGKTVGDGINTLVKTFNLLATGINWVALGKGIAEGLNSLISTVNWDELGQALANRVNIVIWTLYGVISNFDFAAAGSAFAEMVNSFFDYVDWDLLGQTLYKLFGGVLDFIYKAVTGIEWDKVISRFVGGFNTFVSGMRQKFIEFKPKAEEMGKTFGDAINKIFKKVNWEELGGMLADGLNLAIGFLKDAILTIEWDTAGEDLASSIDSFIHDVDWDGIGETINGAFQGVLDFVQAALDYFAENDTATELGNNIRDMLGHIKWREIATKTWNAIKSAFSAAGSFVDALFSEPIDYSRAQIDGAYLAKAMDFNAKPLGERMALKIEGVFEAIPWKDIAETTWKGIKEAFKVAGDFVATLLGAEDASPAAIGKAVGEKLAEIPWASIFETLKETIMGFLNPAIEELLGSKDGRVFIAVSGALLALQLGLGKLITGIFAGLAGTVGAGGLVIAGAIADIVGVIKAVDLAKEIDQSADDLKTSIQNQLDTLKGYYERGEEDLAAVYAKAAFGVDISGQSYQEALKTSTDAIRELYKDAPTSWFDALFSTNETVADQIEAEGQKSMQMYYLGFMNELGNTGEITKEFSNALDGILAAADYNGGGETGAERFYNGFVYAITNNNGEVESQYKDAVEKIFGSVEPFEKGTMTIDQFYEAFQKGAVDEAGKLTPEFKAIMEKVYASVDSKKHGDDYVTSLYNAFKTKIMDNGHVKEEYKSAFEQIFGSVDGLEDGSMTAKQFFDGWNQGVTDNKTPAQEAIVGAFEDAVKDVNSTLGIASPSTVAAEIAKYFLEGFAQGAENNQESAKNRVSAVFKTISDAVSNVVSGVKSFFSKMFGGGKKDTDTGVSADDIAKPYEDGASRAKTALNTLKTTTNTAIKGIGTGFADLSKKASTAYENIEKAADSNMSSTKSVSESSLNSIKDTFATTFDDIKKGIAQNYNDIKKNVQESLKNIQTDSANKTKSIKDDTTKNFGQMESDVTRKTNAMERSFARSSSNIISSAGRMFGTIVDHLNEYRRAEESGSEGFRELTSVTTSGMNSIIEAVGHTSEISQTLTNNIRNAYEAARSVDFDSVGTGIIDGIIRGINNGWNWLKNTVQNLANAALKAAKAALGIHSPSHLFRDEVGQNMVAGMAEGLEDGEPNMLKTISNIAQNAADEMAKSKITANVATNDLVDGLDEVLSVFSDKVTNSFGSMIEKLSAIAASVTFREPNVAAGTVLPYSVSSNSRSDSKAATEAQKDANDELINSMIQLVNNQTSALVQAIQQYGGTTVNIDVHSLTDAIVSEINRRTRANGKSPLLS